MLTRKFSLVFALALTATAFSQQASAHAHLKSQYPAANANVEASPPALTLTFSEDIEPAFSGIEVLDGNQKPVPLAKAERAPAQHNQMIIPLEKPLANGHYQVNWHVLSVDGHKTNGNYSFSVK
ncbi:CopC domain-containing protein YobA [Pantoea sp. BAV 3049]|uniref:CopC domain-containing protein YobA n=1 Tax=Pantoea sp. BAV 3049 TaxID=2654188 RepID=UPI00131C261C|nr:CopC domain-containing protein YobA [Pantoea sp. BAV 3049]